LTNQKLELPLFNNFYYFIGIGLLLLLGIERLPLLDIGCMLLLGIGRLPLIYHIPIS
jgi:hypothetical protein